jgi:hypothetical protein
MFALKAAAFTATAVFAIVLRCVEKLDELLFPVLPGSEQFRLQQTRAIEASGPLLRAFLQQSGTLDIGHVPSCWCAPTPLTTVSISTLNTAAVSRFRITVTTIVRPRIWCQTRTTRATVGRPRRAALQSIPHIASLTDL